MPLSVNTEGLYPELRSEENYCALESICKKYNLNVYFWSSIDCISIFPDGVSDIDLYGSPNVLKIDKSDLVDPDWEEIENSVMTHSLLVTF